MVGSEHPHFPEHGSAQLHSEAAAVSQCCGTQGQASAAEHLGLRRGAG